VAEGEGGERERVRGLLYFAMAMRLGALAELLLLRAADLLGGPSAARSALSAVEDVEKLFGRGAAATVKHLLHEIGSTASGGERPRGEHARALLKRARAAKQLTRILEELLAEEGGGAWPG